MPGQGCIAQLEEQVPLKHQVVGRRATVHWTVCAPSDVLGGRREIRCQR